MKETRKERKEEEEEEEEENSKKGKGKVATKNKGTGHGQYKLFTTKAWPQSRVFRELVDKLARCSFRGLSWALQFRIFFAKFGSPNLPIFYE